MQNCKQLECEISRILLKHNRSFISAFTICMTVPLIEKKWMISYNLIKLSGHYKKCLEKYVNESNVGIMFVLMFTEYQ